MSSRSFVLLVVLAAICAEFPITSAFQWVKDPGTEKKITYPNQEKLVLRWEWRLSGQESLNQAQINRYKTEDQLKTDKQIALLYSNGNQEKYESNVELETAVGTTGGSNGYMELTINDVKNQGKNQDDSKVDVMLSNYTYKCILTVQKVDAQPRTTKLIVQERPIITTAPADEYVDGTNKNVVLKCQASGKPKPNIVWEISRALGISTTKGEELNISQLSGVDFIKDSGVGIYTCTATNDVGKANASAVVQYTECESGCSTDDKIAIEMTDLKYSNGYDTKGSDNYKKLKFDIERECMKQYFNAKKKIYSCVVTGFREGSVVANIKITYPTGTSEPRKPLQTAIETGRFARHSVEKKFVSPTSPPTQATQPTDKSTDKPSDSPDSGKRANDDTSGSLSKVAIISMVVVFSIIFIVIIVVLIVCMLKRRKPAGSHIKPYQEDGKGRTAASAPLKSQPYKDPLYDNEPDKPKDVVYADLNFQDRHTNGGGPPPQYTPSSNYAEVRPSQAEQNESGVEWDKSVRDEMWI